MWRPSTRRVLLSIAFGTLATIGSAWAIAWMEPPWLVRLGTLGRPHPTATTPEPTDYLSAMRADAEAARNGCASALGRRASWTSVELDQPNTLSATKLTQIRSYGLPLPALSHTTERIDLAFIGYSCAPSFYELPARSYTAIPVEHINGATTLLPLIPTPALPSNVLLWATGCYLAISACVGVREGRRTRAGRCPKCNYNVGNLAVCPECAAARATSA